MQRHTGALEGDADPKVFGYEAALGELIPEVAVLAAVTAVLLVGAALLARRWRQA